MKTSNNLPSVRHFLSLLLLLTLTTISAMAGPDDPKKLTGTWQNAKATRSVTFYTENEKFFGKIVTVAAGEEESKPGDILFRDLSWNRDHFEGKAVTPKGEVSCSISFKTYDQLEITFTKGLMSRTVKWTRYAP